MRHRKTGRRFDMDTPQRISMFRNITTAVLEPDALQQLVKERLAGYKAPRWVDFVADLPKTTTGKIQRFRLRTSS